MKSERRTPQRSGFWSRRLSLAIAGVVLGGGWLATHDPLWPYIATGLAFDGKPTATIPQLSLETTIPLGRIRGRIDHLALDLARKRLFVAELGNDSVAVVDLAAGKLLTRLTGLNEPQGVGFAPRTDQLFVANGGTGVVAIFRGDDFARVAEVRLGDDADDIRLDQDGNVVIGYGAGGLATLDPTTGARAGDVKLGVHPEAFQIDPTSNRIYVNEPRALRIAVIDRTSGEEIAKWGAPGAVANFPMALDSQGRRLFVAYRMPALLAAFDTQSGALAGKVETCRDADDLYYDGARGRLYVICGEGAIAVVSVDAKRLSEMSRLLTRRGARTGLYSRELDRLYVAVPARQDEQAEIRVYRPR